jgi:hypothetical protein
MLPLLALLGVQAGSNAVNGIVGGITSAMASGSQQKAAKQARGQITGAYNEAKGAQQPYYDVGTRNMQTLDQMVNQGSFQTSPYQYQMGEAPQEEFNFQADPGYQFRMQQGLRATGSKAAAGGMQLSGATLKALSRYGQGMASNEMQNAYERFNQTRNFKQGQYEFGTNAGMSNEMNRYNTANQQGQQRYSQYSGLADMGQQAAGNLASLATNYGNSIANTTIQGGNAKAAGIMGTGQAIGNIFGNAGQTATLGMMMQPQQGFNAQQYFQNTYGKMPWE